MSEDADPSEEARPATVADLKHLLSALAVEVVDYVLIGGYALYALGYQRATTESALQISANPHRRSRCGVNANSAISRD